MNFTLIIKDRSDFGNVALQGIHQCLENDRDVENILYSVDRDGFGRVFVYVFGWDEGTFDPFELGDLIRQLTAAGGKLAAHAGPHMGCIKAINDALSFEQYFKVTNGRDGTYKGHFERALKVSKKKSVQEAAVKGLKYCTVYGW